MIPKFCSALPGLFVKVSGDAMDIDSGFLWSIYYYLDRKRRKSIIIDTDKEGNYKIDFKYKIKY